MHAHAAPQVLRMQTFIVNHIYSAFLQSLSITKESAMPNNSSHYIWVGVAWLLLLTEPSYPEKNNHDLSWPYTWAVRLSVYNIIVIKLVLPDNMLLVQGRSPANCCKREAVQGSQVTTAYTRDSQQNFERAVQYSICFCKQSRYQ